LTNIFLPKFALKVESQHNI